MRHKRRKIPRSTAPNEPLPQTVGEAVAFLQQISSPEVIATITSTPFNDLSHFHRDIGMQIRNHLGLWGQNRALIDNLPPEVRWPDNAALYILEAWWHFLHAPT